jgi:hypothetical protein
MRPLIIVGLALTAVAAIAGIGLFLLLLAAIALSTSSGPSYPTDIGTYPGGYSEYPAGVGNYTDLHEHVLSGNSPPYESSPADPWLNGNEIDGRMYGSGTIDTSGEGNHVLSVGGEVLNLPN